MRGFVESIGPREVRGWVEVKDGSDGEYVELVLNGAVLATQQLIQPRPDLEKQKVNAKAFALEIPVSVSLTDIRSLHVTYQKAAVPKLKQLKLTLPLVANVLGQIGATIVGELGDLRGPIPTPTLGVMTSDGRQIPSQILIEPNRARASQLGFRFLLTVHYEYAGEFVATEAESGVELCRFRLAKYGKITEQATEKPIGSVDTKGPVFCAGWVYRGADERAGVVELLVDGAVFAEAEASRPREDVGLTYGIQNTGFILPLPRNVGSSKIEVRRKSDKKIIPGSGFTLTGANARGSSRQLTAGLELTIADPTLVIDDLDTRFEVYDHYNKVAWFSPRAVAYKGDGASYLLPIDTKNLSRPTVVIEPGGASIPVEPMIYASSSFRGQVDGIVIGLVTGWLSDPADEDRTLSVLLYIDGEFQGCFPAAEQRTDLRGVGLNNTRHGFAIPVPARFCDGLNHTIFVYEAGSLAPLRNSPTRARTPNRRGVEFEESNIQLSQYRRPAFYSSSATESPLETPTASIIVLTRDAAEVLDRVLQSVYQFLPNKSYFELIIVDHDSADNTTAVVEKWGTEMNITLISVPGNNSFSMSNNRAVGFARGEYVLFLNNDIVLVDDVVTPAVDSLANNNELGLVGIKLLEVDKNDVRGYSEKQIVHHLGIAGVDDYRFDTVRALEIVNDADNTWRSFTATLSASVTGAYALMRKKEFLAIGGFDEDFFYGGEDVDLGLKVWRHLGKSVVSFNRLVSFHHRGYLRLSRKIPADIRNRISENNNRIQQKWGIFLRHQYKQSLLSGDMIFSQERLRIAFIVAQRDVGARTGELFTALELGAALKKTLDCEVLMKSPDDDWSDFSDVHVFINMLSEFSLTGIRRSKSTALKIAWLRNSFESWAAGRELHAYDLVLCSSEKFCEQLRSQYGILAHHFEIATNPELMCSGRAQPRFASDVVFNGSNNGGNRQIGTSFVNETPSFAFKVVGSGWEGTDLARFSVGFSTYQSMPDVYASTKIVIDDANTSAREWGGVNSRVFDAIAAGVLPLTNSAEAARQSFDGLLPVWNTPEELRGLIENFLGDRKLRDSTVAKLKTIVDRRHTYAARAKQLLDYMNTAIKTPSILIHSAPLQDRWENHEVAIEDLANQLRMRGHSVQVQTIGERKLRGFDVHLHVGDGTGISPSDGHLNFLWLLDSPRNTSLQAVPKLDGIFVTSEKAAALMRDSGQTAHICRPWPSAPRSLEKDLELLFYAKDLYQSQHLAKQLIENEPEVRIVGEAWENFVPAEYVVDVRSDVARAETLSRARFVVFAQDDQGRKAGVYPPALYRALSEKTIALVNMDKGDLSAQEGVRTFSDFKDLSRQLEKLRREAKPPVLQEEAPGNIIHKVIAELYCKSALRSQSGS